MPWKCEIYGKNITNMLHKVYWKKHFSGIRILITPFNYSFQYSFQIIYKRPLALFWVGVCWSTFLCFLKSAHNHSWVHIWVDVYFNEYGRLTLNRNNFCCVIVDYCFFGEELWKYIISNFHFHAIPRSNSSLNLQTE